MPAAKVSETNRKIIRLDKYHLKLFQQNDQEMHEVKLIISWWGGRLRSDTWARLTNSRSPACAKGFLDLENSFQDFEKAVPSGLSPTL